MKKLVFTISICSLLVFVSCKKDGIEILCLKCTTTNPDVIISSSEVCEGDIDPNTEQVITREMLKQSKSIIESFPDTSCTLK